MMYLKIYILKMTAYKWLVVKLFERCRFVDLDFVLLSVICYQYIHGIMRFVLKPIM